MKRQRKKKKLPTVSTAARAAVPNQRAVDALEGVLDAAEEEVPEDLRRYAPMMRAGLAVLLGVGSEGGKPFTVDVGGGAVIVRPVDARAVAMRAMNELVVDLIPELTRERARAAFKEKLKAKK